jgi:hypothetical protein
VKIFDEPLGCSSYSRAFSTLSRRKLQWNKNIYYVRCLPSISITHSARCRSRNVSYQFWIFPRSPPYQSRAEQFYFLFMIGKCDSFLSLRGFSLLSVTVTIVGAGAIKTCFFVSPSTSRVIWHSTRTNLDLPVLRHLIDSCKRLRCHIARDYQNGGVVIGERHATFPSMGLKHFAWLESS